MHKYLTIFILAILFTACGDENNESHTVVEATKVPPNKQAILFPSLPSKNIETSTLDELK